MEIGLGGIRFPEHLAGRFLIHFPNSEIELSEGIAKNQLWEATHDSIIENPNNIKTFQFLVLIPREGQAEVVSDIHFARGKLSPGPFISADYKNAGERNDILLELLSEEKGVMVEIDGVPEGGYIVNARRISETGWKMPFENKIRLNLPNEGVDGASLTITAFASKTPRTSSTFTLVLPTHPRPNGYHKRFRDVKIDLKEALGHIPRIFYVKLPEHACIPHGKKLGQRWLVQNTETLTVRMFGPTQKADIEVTYIAPDGFGDFEEVIAKISCDFSKAASQIRDYRECVFCVSAQKCQIFRDFMNYVGNDTMLRQIF